MDALIIANTQIRQDAAGRFCLNDLHQASGGEARKRPSYWLDLDGTDALIEQVQVEAGIPATDAGISASVEPVSSIRGGYGQGTYAVKEKEANIESGALSLKFERPAKLAARLAGD